jgi:hypothetical protein
LWKEVYGIYGLIKQLASVFPSAEKFNTVLRNATQYFFVERGTRGLIKQLASVFPSTEQISKIHTWKKAHSIAQKAQH